MTYIIPFDEEIYSATMFSSETFLYHINQFLNNSYKNQYTISEVAIDNDELMYPDCTAKKWCVKLHNIVEIDKARYLRESHYVIPRYEVHITFTDCIAKLGYNVVEIDDYSNVRNDICGNAIAMIGHFMKKTEKEVAERYAERETMLMFIYGAITNYDDYSVKDLMQVRNEKIKTKKRNVLEDPMWMRELLQNIDYMITPISKTIKQPCNIINY